MALYCLLKLGIVQMVCFVKIKFGFEWALNSILQEPVAMTNGPQMSYIYKPNGSKENDLSVFFYVFLCFKPMTPWGRSN